MQVFLNKERVGNLTKTGNTTVQLSSSIITLGAKQYSTSNLICDITLSGAGGIDTGSVQANKVYYIYAVFSSGSVKLIASLTITNPVGFSVNKYVGAIQTNNVGQISMVSQGEDFDTELETYSLTIGSTGGTPPTKGTIVRDIAGWRRFRDVMEITYNYKQTGVGVTGTGTYLYPLPTTY